MKQFIISTTFVVILVMVVISMAIIIPSTKIYEQTNNKIIDNQISSVEINENQVEQSTGIRSGIDRGVYSKNIEGTSESYGRVFDKFNNYILTNTTEPFLGTSTLYTYYLEEKLEVIPYGEIEEDFSSFDLYLTQNLGELMPDMTKANIGTVVTKLGKNLVESKEEFDLLEATITTHTLISNSGNTAFQILAQKGFDMVYAIDTTLSSSEKIVIYFKTRYFLGVDCNSVDLIDELQGAEVWAIFLSSFSYQPSYTSVTQTSTKITNGVGTKPILLSSNELTTNLTTINSDTYTDIASAFVLSGYANGKETATVLCDISEYYDDNLVLSISTQDNALPMIFNVGDIVIPYVTKNVYDSITGTYSLTEVPLSIINGNPKLFKVVSNKIISDGVPRQKLTLVESDKLYVDNTTTCIATDITAIGLSITTPTELTYIPTSDNLTTFTFNPRIGDGIKLIGVKGATVFPIWKYNDTEINFGSGSEYTRGSLATTNPYLTFIASATTVGDTYECMRDTTINGFKVDLSGGAFFGGSLGTGGIYLDNFKFSNTENVYVYPKTGNAVKIVCYPSIDETVAWTYNGNPITSGVGGYTINNTGGDLPKSELTFTANATNCNGTYYGTSS